MLNRVTLMGTIASTPKYKEFPNGGTIVSFNLLTQKVFKDPRDPAGEPVCKNTYNRVCIRNTALIPHLIPHLKEDAKFYIEGELETRSWVDDKGDKQYITEVSVSPVTGRIVPISLFIKTTKEHEQPKPIETTPNPDPLDDTIPF